ncbi:MAG TPA: isochorismatase family cysteine hydrolase [Opitutaceae bacterium]|nr:isochorismatase family cysteine hydrolase [Opitutaceae bacterium]
MPSLPIILDPTRTAVLCMDYQAGIVAGLPGNQDALLQRAAETLAAARQAKLMVIHVVVAFRPGHPEIGPNNLLFSGLKQSGRFAAGDQNSDIHPAVFPQPGDIVVTKRRVSAFAGSDLELILRARGIDTLVLFGIATGGVVLSTVRQAADSDYRLVVLADACADREADVHRCLVEKILPRQATVVPADAFIASLSG